MKDSEGNDWNDMLADRGNERDIFPEVSFLMTKVHNGLAAGSALHLNVWQVLS